MPIFHEIKLIHVHNPRCGGTSINKAILKGLGLPNSTFSPKAVSYHYLYGNHKTSDNFYELDHLCFSLIKNAIPSWILNDYNAFVIVRHPWDRFVSEYTRKASINCKRFLNPRGISFETYCKNFIEKVKRKFSVSDPYRFNGVSHFNGCHFLPQYIYAGLELPDAQKKPIIIDIKDINKSVPRLCHEMHDNVELQLRKMHNSHKQKINDEIKYQIANISPQVRSAVEDFYHLDYKMLGYSRL